MGGERVDPRKKGQAPAKKQQVEQSTESPLDLTSISKVSQLAQQEGGTGGDNGPGLGVPTGTNGIDRGTQRALAKASPSNVVPMKPPRRGGGVSPKIAPQVEHFEQLSQGKGPEQPRKPLPIESDPVLARLQQEQNVPKRVEQFGGGRTAKPTTDQTNETPPQDPEQVRQQEEREVRQQTQVQERVQRQTEQEEQRLERQTQQEEQTRNEGGSETSGETNDGELSDIRARPVTEGP